MITKNQHIPFVVKSVIADTPGHWSVIFERPRNFEYEAGDWIDIDFSPQLLSGGVTYSLSSSPTEPDIRITFKEGLSGVKVALRNLQIGDTLYISQYGNDYGFQLSQGGASILIAGGVGIAPFRSMIKQMFDRNDKNTVTLLYMNKDENFLFKTELDTWQEALPGASIQYIQTNDINRKKREKTILAHATNPRDNYYIAGPPAMVDSNEHLLIDAGIPIKSIRVDIFGGY